jgi:hypothetical protein
MHWRIWFVMYKNGSKVGSGLWYKHYKYYGHAKRWAEYRFGKPHIHEYTGDIYTYEWVVSKTNPWK